MELRGGHGLELRLGGDGVSARGGSVKDALERAVASQRHIPHPAAQGVLGLLAVQQHRPKVPSATSAASVRVRPVLAPRPPGCGERTRTPLQHRLEHGAQRADAYAARDHEQRGVPVLCRHEKLAPDATRTSSPGLAPSWIQCDVPWVRDCLHATSKVPSRASCPGTTRSSTPRLVHARGVEIDPLSGSERELAALYALRRHAQSKQLHRGRLLHHTRDGGDDRAVTAVPVRRFPLQRYYGTVDSLRGARRGARTFRGDARAAPHGTSATSGAKPLVDTSRQAPCKLRRRRRGSPRETNKTSTPRRGCSARRELTCCEGAPNPENPFKPSHSPRALRTQVRVA